MPISGLLLTLQNPESLPAIREAIQGLCDAEIGNLQERWLPIAVDTSDSRSARNLHDELMAIDGVAYVDVVSVAFDGDSAPADRSPLAKATRS